MSPAGGTSRRSRGGGSLAWLQAEGGGDAAAVREQLAALAGPAGPGEQVQDIPCDYIDRSPYQARRIFPADAMASLKDSIRRNKLLQPIVLRPRPGGRFELIAGERRWRVVRMLGWESISAVIRAVDDITAHLLGQIENDERENLSAWEKALGYVDLREHVRQENGIEPQLAELGELRGGVDKSTVSRYLTIGEAFPPESLIRADITEEEMASLSLPSLLRAARKPEGQRFTMLRDVLRKRRSRAAERARRRSHRPADTSSGSVDLRPPAEDPGPAARPDDGTASAAPDWQRYFAERGIRIETMVPAQELTPKQARAAAERMLPALAALAARCASSDHPAPLFLEVPAGRLAYLPEAVAGEALQAYESLRTAAQGE